MKLRPLLGLIAFVASQLAGFSVTAEATTGHPLQVYWIDSEGGGSTLIVTPAGESVLIDAGNPGQRDAARIVAAAKAAGLTKIDYFLLTHYHIDHFGGAAEVAQTIPFGAIYQRAIPDHDPDGRATSSFAQQIEPYRQIPGRRVALAPGVVIPLRQAPGQPTLTLRCLAADQKVIAADAARGAGGAASAVETRAIAPSDNDNSAAFLLTYGDFKFFDGGDLTWNFEARLVTPQNLVGRVDVYQTDHHGLEVSNNPVLVQALAPTVSVMNNGPWKGGKEETLAMLKHVPTLQARYQIHRSMSQQAVDNTTNEYIANLVDAKPADRCTANAITMSVAPDARSYTIAIPANGHSHTYATTDKRDPAAN